MNIREAKEAVESGELFEADVLRSPENKFHWFLILRDRQAKHFMLIGDDEAVETYASIDAAANVARHIGFKYLNVKL